jgi:DNA invertase Pin-like site-specific DNA recombinase
MHLDDARLIGRGKNAAWRSLIANFEGIDQIALSNASDIPGRTVADLLEVLSVLQRHNVRIKLHDLDTGQATCEMLDLIAAYRRGKLSQAIRAGQARAVIGGKRIGRPKIPTGITNQIKAVLANGGGIRPTARTFRVSPATIVNIRGTMAAAECALSSMASCSQ